MWNDEQPALDVTVTDDVIAEYINMMRIAACCRHDAPRGVKLNDRNKFDAT